MRNLSSLCLLCGLVLAVEAGAQETKAGLWEIASAISFQRSGQVGMFGEVANGPSLDNAPRAQVCFTRELIDRYGVILPPSLKDCQLSHVARTSNRMTADMICTGRTRGTGSMEATWSDASHVRGKVHFAETFKEGPRALTMGWTQEVAAEFKSADCGSVKPRSPR